jgi:deferrochelatase/peroxidase EfeB
LSYSNLSCLGEFLLGYPNEYGQYTPRPLLAPEGASARLPRAEDDPGRADFGRNGSYLVIRQLRQDVDGFWHELDQRAGGDADLRERLAAAMVGRKKSGEPLVSSAAGACTDRTDRSALNDFTFQSDPRGERCPIGAHIRRANPRNADFPAGSEGLLKRLIRMLGFDASVLHEDLIASTRFHRLLRRGRKYDGSPPNSGPTQADAPADERGLHFMCLASNITRQFEFVQSAWLMGSGFAGLCGETDPLLDNPETAPDGFASDFFSLPQKDGPDRRLTGLPRFVTVVGGAYFFLPGVRALRYLAAAS